MLLSGTGTWVDIPPQNLGKAPPFECKFYDLQQELAQGPAGALHVQAAHSAPVRHPQNQLLSLPKRWSHLERPT